MFALSYECMYTYVAAHILNSKYYFYSIKVKYHLFCSINHSTTAIDIKNAYFIKLLDIRPNFVLCLSYFFED